MSTEQSAGQPSTAPRSGAWSLAGLVVGGVIINWLSGIWAPAAPVVIVLALISLPLLALSDGSRFEHSPVLAWTMRLKRDGFVELCLAALVLGFAIACISIVPIWPTAAIESPFPGTLMGLNGGAMKTTNYEVGAVSVIVLMVTAAAYRAPSLLRQTAFLVCALYGVAIAYSYFRPHENAFLPTFAGGFLIAATLTALLTALPRMFIVLRSFWGFGEQAQSHTTAESLHEDNGPAPDGEPKTEASAGAFNNVNR